MAINKVIVNGETKLDLTADTATAENVVEGFTFHDATGELKTGTFVGTAGTTPLYFYELNRDNIDDSNGVFGATQFKVCIDSIILENQNGHKAWVYINGHNGGSETEIVSYYDSITFGNIVSNGLKCVVISDSPIISVSAHTEREGGY